MNALSTVTYDEIDAVLSEYFEFQDLIQETGSETLTATAEADDDVLSETRRRIRLLRNADLRAGLTPVSSETSYELVDAASADGNIEVTAYVTTALNYTHRDGSPVESGMGDERTYGFERNSSGQLELTSDVVAEAPPAEDADTIGDVPILDDLPSAEERGATELDTGAHR